MENELESNSSLWSLFEDTLKLQNVEECAAFFRDLCTFSELQALAERWHVARMVDQGLPYRKISRLTGASTATITRVAHWVRHGQGGYRTLLDRRQEQQLEDRPR